MCNKTAQEVQAVIADSKYDKQVELIMSRIITADSRRAAQMSWRQYQLQSRYRQTGITAAKAIIYLDESNGNKIKNENSAVVLLCVCNTFFLWILTESYTFRLNVSYYFSIFVT